MVGGGSITSELEQICSIPVAKHYLECLFWCSDIGIYFLLGVGIFANTIHVRCKTEKTQKGFNINKILITHMNIHMILRYVPEAMTIFGAKQL